MLKPAFDLRILGPTELHGPDAERAEAFARQTKRLALLAYLAVVGAAGFRRRDQVAELFWPELDAATARTYLRKALHGIRDALGTDVILTRGEDEIRVDPACLSCDAVVLAAAMEEGRWSEALTLYRGELLEGLFPEGVAHGFEDWLSRERRRLREQAALAAWRCSEAEEARGDRTAAALMARRARELDPDNEEGVRRLMELLDRRGDRGSALRVFAEWQARLQEEFGVEPAPETRRVARRIQAARKGESHETPPVAPPSSARLPQADAGEPPPAFDDASRSREPAAVGPGTRRSWLGFVLALVAVAFLVVWWARFGRERVDPNSLALTHLRAIGDGDAGFLARAITEGLATGLAADTALRVQVLHGEETPDRILRTLGSVRVAVEGGVRFGGGSAVLTIRLVRQADGVTEFAQEYRASSENLNELADLLVDSVLRDLRARLGR